MSSLRSCAVALLLLLLAARGVPAQEPPPDSGEDDGDVGAQSVAPDPGEYEQSLAPYGQWMDGGSYGRVWSPAVSYGWQPYVDGYWAWSPYGWTWISYEPWSWTFHYGRWALLPAGWVWVPGTVWGPAWVDWYWGDGFVGWAPLSPFASHVSVINSFVFVSDRDFCSHRIRPLVRDWHLVPDDVVHRWGRRDFGPPPRDRIERIAHEPVRRFAGRPPGTIGPPVVDGHPGRGPRFVRRDDRPRDDSGWGSRGGTTFAPPAPGGQRLGPTRPERRDVPDAAAGRIPETPRLRGPGFAAVRPTMNLAPPLVPARGMAPGGFGPGDGRARSGHEHPGAGRGGGQHAEGQGGMLAR